MSEQSYIVRIYRRNRKSEGRDGLVGIVEMPESGQRAAFHDAQGLWHILADTKHQRQKRRRVATTKGGTQ